MPETELAFEVLTPADTAAYNAFLSRGCVQHPETLRIDPADIVASPFTPFDSPESCTLAALAADGRWLGVGTLEREQGRAKRRHIAWILRMYVAEPGRGIGRALLRRLKARALEMAGVSKLNLTVAAHNAQAVELYRSEGFQEFSREPGAFFVASRPITELSMACEL